MIYRESWHQELEAAIQRWDDPDFLPAQVDEIDRNLQTLMISAAPLINAIERAPRTEEVSIPYRAREFARKLRLDLEEQADHVDHFLNRKTMWNAKSYEAFLRDIASTQETVVQFYQDMIPFLDQLNARLPQRQEQALLGQLKSLALPSSSEEDEVMDAEFTVER